MSILTSLTRVWLTRSFRPFQFTSKFDVQLDYEDALNLGLYIHIPFCLKICSFCPYCKQVFEEENARAYVLALKREIEIVGAMTPGRKKVTTLYFGGGSPALIATEIKSIIETVQQYFEVTEGIGIELHPSEVTVDKLSILKEAGVTRISIGIQSFQKKYLDILERDEYDCQKIFEALNQVEFETVSMDFIFALPGQTIESLKNDIETAFSNGANHIAIYPFIDFTYTQRKFEKIPETKKKKLLFEIQQYCESRDYVRDSIWTFAKKDTKKYSSMTRDNFLGFGCSATTLLKDSFKINTFSLPEYFSRIEQNTLPTALTLKFALRQRMIYYLFWTAYTTRVDAIGFENTFGKNLEHYYGLELAIARRLGLIIKNDGVYHMTPKGVYYYHYYENFYTLAYIDRMWNLMRIDPFPEKLDL
jgi:menaquinone C8-methyltransferase